MRYLYLFLSAFFLCSASFSQSTQWSNYFSNGLVKVDYKEIDCQVSQTDINKKLLVFRMSNLTSKKIEVNWNNELHYGDRCLNCDGNSKELNHAITLEAGQTIEGSCDSKSGTNASALVIFKKFNTPQVMIDKGRKLTDFKLKNIRAETLINK